MRRATTDPLTARRTRGPRPFFPRLGWVGFDPTNNLIAEDRHIRVAVGRDYADVPPTRGVYKGSTAVRSELAVAVRVGPAAPPLSCDVLPFTPWMSREASAPMPLRRLATGSAAAVEIRRCPRSGAPVADRNRRALPVL